MARFKPAEARFGYARKLTAQLAAALKSAVIRPD
jgi:hypothetical protein